MNEAINLLKDLLRILTLEEINSLTTTSQKAEQRTPMTDIVFQYLAVKEKEAPPENVIPFPISQTVANPQVEEATTESGDKKSTPVFILEEQKKIKAKQRKLKEIEVRDMYNQESSISIEQERKMKNLAESANLGILINKKHG